ncbi:reverse transcriptase domain-containing protein [Citrus sinensis]|nr:reverse transcriptase domain-containing protein [Citrus sinensis]
MEMGKVREVAEEHLIQVAVKAINIRDNRLHDIGEAKLSNAAGKCSPRKLECRAGTSGRRESESHNILEVEESVNGPIKANSKAQIEKGSIMGRQTKTKRPSSTLSGQSPKSKRAKLNSPNKALNNKLQINAPAMKIQLAWEHTINGKSEGIVIMWKSDINVHILSYSRHYIDVKVQSGNGKKWRCTGVYGHPEAQQKQHTWTLLRRLSGLSSKPWLCFVEGMIKTLGWFLSSKKLFKIVSWLIWVIKGINSRGWSEEEFGGQERKLKTLMKELQKAKQSKMHYEEANGIRQIEKQIHNILLEEEIYWRHRVRANWLQTGDKNTKFFHSKATARKRKNRIWGVEKKEGSWTEDGEAIERDQDQMNAALEGLTPKVTATMNDQLNASFTAEEISEALFQMCPTKAPGPDGLNSMFFQKHWQHVGKGVTQTCLHILNNQGNLSPLNHTFIALIPKVAKPRKVTEYRPISLCNVVYRIVAKVIANRLKQVLHQIISPYQSAFVPNRIITDNIVIGYECLHKIRHSKGRKNELVSLKLDISKVYDRVEWGFLEHIMRRLGFIEKWVQLVMK